MMSIGLMSGASLDGIDAAVLSTDGERLVSLGPVLTRPYPTRFRQRLRGLLGRKPDADAIEVEVVRDLTFLHAEAVGWNGNGLEAQAFAFLAVHSVLGMPLSLPSTIGVRAPQTGGERRRPPGGFRH